MKQGLSSLGVSASSEIERPLTRREGLNLLFSLLAWAATVSNVTLIVGTSNVILLSIGGSVRQSALPLGAFSLGSSGVSLFLTPWLFARAGRKIGFMVGNGIGLLGTALGAIALVYSMVALWVVAVLCFGAAMGVGFFLRFAAIEVVPSFWSAKAMTLVVSGGCIAAFAGPESALGTEGMFGENGNLLYMGTIMMAGIFCVATMIFIALIDFPIPRHKKHDIETIPPDEFRATLLSLLTTRQFLIPMLLAATSWAIMALPMSLLRVTMTQLGFSSRQSLLTIEMHFLGMYSPGFVSGRWIHRWGARTVCAMSIVVSVVAIVVDLVARQNTGNAASITPWIVGLFFIGAGWNLSFTGATVWATRTYEHHMAYKSAVQAANDCLMFLLAGAWILSASSIYQAGGGYLPGWRVVNYVSLGLVGVYGALIGGDCLMDYRHRTLADERDEEAPKLDDREDIDSNESQPTAAVEAFSLGIYEMDIDARGS